VEVEAGDAREICRVDQIPLALGGLARHNIANALAAAGGARAMGASLADVSAGLRDFRPTAEQSPGRLNIFRHGAHVVIVDFAHNEAGIEALLGVAGGLAAGGAARTWPVTAIIGTAGDRPDDALRAIGRIAAERSDRVAIKETLPYLRGRPREHVVAELRAGIASAGRDPAAVPVYETEVEALRAELAIAAGPDERGRPDQPHVVVLLSHAERQEVYALLADLGARPVDTPAELRSLVPRLSARPLS
jgi:UDP-N-acetylmuramyl tripeptide synthase